MPPCGSAGTACGLREGADPCPTDRHRNFSWPGGRSSAAARPRPSVPRRWPLTPRAGRAEAREGGMARVAARERSTNRRRPGLRAIAGTALVLALGGAIGLAALFRPADPGPPPDWPASSERSAMAAVLAALPPSETVPE